MRTFANFLYMGNLFNVVPEQNPDLRNAYYRVFRPTISVVEEDCGTRLGLTEALIVSRTQANDCTDAATLTNSLQGYIDLLNGDNPLVPGPVSLQGSLLWYESQGVSSLKIRSVAACNSIGGVCRKCLWASYELLYPAFNRSTINVVGDYPDITATSTTITTPVVVPPVGSRVPVDFTVNTTPFLSYLSRSFSGSLIGTRSYINDRLPLREGLYETTILTDNVVAHFVRAIIDSGVVGTMELEYGKNIPSAVEKFLYLLAVYTISYSVSQ